MINIMMNNNQTIEIIKNENKLKTWFINIHKKLKFNVDYFVKFNWIKKNIEQIKILYVVDRLKKNVLNHIKSNITKKYTMFDHENWQIIVIVIKQIYNETNFVKIERRKFIVFYQRNKNFEIFWNEFHRLVKQTKMSNDQILNYLKNRLFDEIKNRLIKNINISKKLHEFVKMIRIIIINMTKFEIRRIFRNITNNSFRDEKFFVNNQIKITFSNEKFFNSSFFSFKSSIFRSIFTFVFVNISIVDDIYSNFMNLFVAKKKKFLIQKKKNYRKNNKLCFYCEKFDHFVKNHDNFQLLIFKKKIYNFRLIAMFLFFYYRDNECENFVETTTKNEKFSN